jgi:DNA mismatch endonuclease (patch repair protein)
MTTAERSERMARIRSKDTKPELLVRRLLHRLGYRYRLHRRDLPGVPDLAFPGRKKVVFVHGCFWHAHDGCKVANQPKTRQPFWQSKFERNKKRDRANQRSLKQDGWEVCVVWECETKNREQLALRLSSFLGAAKDGIGTERRHG